tara:strand:- start:2222 stop:2659 length:438 start_codon:yes stop_codon:yes gene_type:complete
MSGKNHNNIVIIQELMKNQLDTVPLNYKLTFGDFKRLSKNLDKSIFDQECSCWKGFINKKKNNKKYVNFYFRKKKIAINRLLYMNYIGPLEKSSYLSYTCHNNGICCNINHFKIKNSECKISKNIVEHISKKPKLLKDKKIIFEG